MKNLVIVLTATFLLSSLSCKKNCYNCAQYCAYCFNKTDTTFIYDVCANRTQDEPRVDSAMRALQSSGYVCNQLNNQTQVCGDKSAIEKSTVYYEAENYYCYPAE